MREPKSDIIIVYVVINITTGKNSCHYAAKHTFKNKMYRYKNRQDDQYRIVLGELDRFSAVGQNYIKMCASYKEKEKDHGYIVTFYQGGRILVNKPCRVLQEAADLIGLSKGTVAKYYRANRPIEINGLLITVRRSYVKKRDLAKGIRKVELKW